MVIDAECEKANSNIEHIQREIASILKSLTGTVFQLSTICDYVSEHIDIAKCSSTDFISTDNMLQNCQGIIEYKGNPQIKNAIDYQPEDILVSNIRPYLQKIWFADRQGGASPDILVFRVKDKERYLPRYIFYNMRSQAFFDHMMSGRKGLKMPRGDKNVTMRYQIIIPALEIQTAIVKQIQELERQIIVAKQTICAATSHKKAILDKYLQ